MTRCELYGIEHNELLGSKRGVFNEPRSVAIYLPRPLRGDSLTAIGHQCNITKYSTVSNVVERIKVLVSTDRGLRERVEKLHEVSKSQEQA